LGYEFPGCRINPGTGFEGPEDMQQPAHAGAAREVQRAHVQADASTARWRLECLVADVAGAINMVPSK